VDSRGVGRPVTGEAPTIDSSHSNSGNAGGPGLRHGLCEAGFRGSAIAGAPLAPLTTWRLGGPAELLAVPEDREDLATAVRWAVAQGVPWRILGNGSNLLVRDEGVAGLVLRIRKVLNSVRRDGSRLVAGAGASFPAVARLAASAGLAGIEFGVGIPGTVGGAVVMNAGWHEFEIGNAIESVDVLEPRGTTRRFGSEACSFGYRTSRFRGRAGVVLEATLVLEAGDANEIATRLERFAESRKQNQPTEFPSCGSVFLKPDGDFAGRLIEEAGLKGFRIGDLQVSSKHANFFVNLGAGCAADALALVAHVERVVEQRFGTRLVREFELW
jgi:UDP-N-acetylmuramate dehydrogenase